MIGFFNLASARLSPFPYLFPWVLPNFDNTHCLGQEQALGVCTAMARDCRYNPRPPYKTESAVKMYQRAARETRQSLAYYLHENLLPVLTGLETMPESRALWEELELLLQECLPFQIVSICLEG